MTKQTVQAWMLTEVKKPLELQTYEVEVGPGEVLVKVAGCGVCHTDISFAVFGVPTRHEFPLALGHEISGTVVATGEGVDSSLNDKPVLIPAVLPCGECDLCKAGERRICRNQIMPGNDRHGGFADFVCVPARYVCPVPAEVLKNNDLADISVVADADTERGHD